MTDLSKRDFIFRISMGAATIAAAPLAGQEFAFGQGQKNQPAPIIPPQNPADAVPENPTTGLDPKEMLKHHQQQIHDDVEKLYELAGDLKAEVEKTQTEHVLSLPMIQKAEQIEKLAKQVKGLARES
jgi:hypothetical protein